MKKILVLFVLCLGLMSFTDSSALETATENVVSNNLVDIEISTEYVVIDNVDDALYSCRATITYNGEPVASTTGFGLTAAGACAQARLLAMAWIAAQ